MQCNQCDIEIEPGQKVFQKIIKVDGQPVPVVVCDQACCKARDAEEDQLELISSWKPMLAVGESCVLAGSKITGLSDRKITTVTLELDPEASLDKVRKFKNGLVTVRLTMVAVEELPKEETRPAREPWPPDEPSKVWSEGLNQSEVQDLEASGLNSPDEVMGLGSAKALQDRLGWTSYRAKRVMNICKLEN